MLRAIIIDDEKLSREIICNYLRDYCNDVEIVTTASSVKTAYKAIRKHSPDFIFLDIELADGKGFDLLTMFEKIDFKVIFITAHSEYAVKAFRFSAVDYLLKPIKIEELISAIERVKSLLVAGSGQENLAALIHNLNRKPNVPTTLVVPHMKGFEVLRISEIIMCQADGYCTSFHLSDDRRIISSKNLKYYNDLIDEYDFVRVHHSYIINLSYVSGYSRQGEIFLANGLKAALGDSYKANFQKKIGNKKKEHSRIFLKNQNKGQDIGSIS